MSSVEITRATSADARALASLHREVFPHYRTARLGDRFCRKLFEGFTSSADVHVLVARVDGTIVGYLVGAPPATLDELRRDALPHAAIGALFHVRAALDLPALRRGARRIVRRLRKVRSAPSPARASASRVVCLHLIGVATRARGLGVGRRLLRAFEQTFAPAYDEATLSVDTDNASARRLYEAEGWELTSSATGSCSYRRRFPR